MSATRAGVGVSGVGVEFDPASALESQLEAFGMALDEAFARRRRRRFWALPVAILALVAVGAGLGVAALTETARVRVRAPLPAVNGLVEQGLVGGMRWALTATRCPGGYTVSLVTAGGTARSACASAASPANAFYAATANVAIVFGVAPAGMARVAVTDSGGGQHVAVVRRSPSLEHARAVFFAVAFPAAGTVTALTEYSSSARLIEACNERGCVRP
jgi:hypothetical protein